MERRTSIARHSTWLALGASLLASAAPPPGEGGRGTDRHADKPPAAGSVEGNVEIAAVPRRTKYRQLEPVLIDLVFRNRSNRLAVISRGSCGVYHIYMFSVIKDGKNFQETSSYKEKIIDGGLNSKPAFFIPGRVVRDTAALNLVCDMTVPGKYEVEVAVRYAQAGEVDWATTGPFTIEIQEGPDLEDGPGGEGQGKTESSRPEG